MNVTFHLSRICWGRFFLILLLASATLLLSPVRTDAQFKFRQPPNRQDPGSLQARDSRVIWQQFLDNRFIGSFTIEGVLAYRPSGAASRYFPLRLSGDWLPGEQATRVQLVNPEGRDIEASVVIRDNVPWTFPADGPPQRLSTQEMDQFLDPELPFTWNDLLMPYLAWPEPEYQGPDRYLGRPAHRYALLNPDPDAFPARVVVTLDEDFAALLRASLYDADGKLVKRIRIGGFKQFGDDWMFSSLYWEDRSSRSSVRLDVADFHLAR